MQHKFIIQIIIVCLQSAHYMKNAKETELNEDIEQGIEIIFKRKNIKNEIK